MSTDRGMEQERAESRDLNGPGALINRAAGAQVGSGNLQINFYGNPTWAGIGSAPTSASGSGPEGSPDRGHAFISYVREDSGEIDMLQSALEAVGVRVWRDTAELWPGEDWRAKIRDAITRDALVFIACFSGHSAARRKSYQNEEIALAIEQLRLRRPGDPWLIPVRLDNCDVPDLELGAGRTLAWLQRVDLFGPGRDLAAQRLVTAVHRQLLQHPAPPSPEPPGSALGSVADIPARIEAEEAEEQPAVGHSSSTAADTLAPGVHRPVQPGDSPPGLAAANITSGGMRPGREITYWGQVRSHWDEADAAARTGMAPLVLMKKMPVHSTGRRWTSVAVTGLPGAGKTMLYKSLIGGVDLTSNEVEGRSARVERHKALIGTDTGKVYTDTAVIVGTHSAERYATLERFFERGRSPSVVIHVVCWGYNKIWGDSTRRMLREEFTRREKSGDIDLNAILELCRNQELGDFRETCRILQNSWRQGGGELIIAVAKADLYWQERATARDYYLPAGAAHESAFCEELRNLVGMIGASRLRLAVVPVSCYPEDYVFDHTSSARKVHQADATQINGLVKNFRRLLGDFCSHER